MIDTHAHLYAEEFNDDRQAMMERAKAAGVKKIVLPNIDVSSVPELLKLGSAYPGFCYPALGLHPSSVNENFREDLRVLKKELFDNRAKYVAVGEMGIDLYWDKTFEKEQVEAFKEQCNWAYELDLPVIIHSREAIDLIIRLLQEMKERPRGVFHCFTGSTAQAQQIIALGMYLGIGGVLTYKKSELPEVIKSIGAERLVLETDSPYLPPVPYRGKRNETAYVRLVAEKLAEVLGNDLQEIIDHTSRNAEALFALG